MKGHVRRVVRALKDAYPGRAVAAEHARSGHWHYLIDGERVASGADTPGSSDNAIRETLRDVRRYYRQQATR